MEPVAASASVTGGPGQLVLRVQLEPNDIVELMASLSPKQSLGLFDHPKFSEFVSKFGHLSTLRNVHGDYDADDTSTVTGDGISTPTTSTLELLDLDHLNTALTPDGATVPCVDVDHAADKVPRHVSTLTSRLNNMQLFQIVAYAYPDGFKDHWDNAKRGMHNDLKPLQHIYIHHVDSKQYPQLTDIVELLNRHEHGQWYSIYELVEVLRAWGFKAPSPAARYSGFL